MSSIKEKKLKKYLLYAIGEVILIFIGINLAIWFNNWNDGKKAKTEEIQYLNELKSGLTYDLNDIFFNIELHHKAEKSCEIILYNLENDIPYHDSLDLHFAQASNFSASFPKKGAYESLKSIGIGLISNDSLRLKIIDLYEVQFPYALFGQKYDEINYKVFQEQYKSKFKNCIGFTSATPLDYELLKNDNYFKEQIRSTFYLKKLILRLLRGRVKEKTSETIKMIDDELGRLK